MNEREAVRITKKKFKKMYFSMTNKKMADKLGVSSPTVIKIAQKLGFRKKIHGAKIEIIEEQ